MLNKKVLITAGPTYERIDPVRFIGNFSSGKMGFSLAMVSQRLGLDTTLVTGATSLSIDEKVKRYDIITTQEMFSEVQKVYKDMDIIIMSAAVSDYKPKFYSQQKIKKEDNITLELEKNIDILSYLGENKTSQFLVGFALETENEQEYALGKLKKKNLDLIILNSLNERNLVFGSDINTVKILDKNGLIFSAEDKSKDDIAVDIFKIIQQKII